MLLFIQVKHLIAQFVYNATWCVTLALITLVLLDVCRGRAVVRGVAQAHVVGAFVGRGDPGLVTGLTHSTEFTSLELQYTFSMN